MNRMISATMILTVALTAGAASAKGHFETPTVVANPALLQLQQPVVINVPRPKKVNCREGSTLTMNDRGQLVCRPNF